MPAIRFGTDGWRGVIAEDFTVANVRLVARAIARHFVRYERPQAGMLVGYDNRFASERFAQAAAETLAAAGIPAWLAEVPCPSPALSFAVRERGAAGGIMITASHNPYRWNGMKIKAAYGSSASPAAIDAVETELETVLADGIPELPRRPGAVLSFDAHGPYLDALGRLVDWDRLRAAGQRFLFDPMHGSAAGLLPELMRRHGVACDEIRGNRDPLFGGLNPEPIEGPNIEPLRAAMLDGSHDAAFLADGDGDRVGAMDPGGCFITAHQCFAILLWHLAGARGLLGDVARTFSVTSLVDKIAGKYRRRVLETRIGFKYIAELMLERDLLMGGEESGGIGFRFHLPERDATVCALLLAEVMAWHGKRLGELVAALEAEFGQHHYGRLDLELKPGQKDKAIELFGSDRLDRVLDWAVARRESLDGIKLFLDEIGWMMVRASGTEPLLRIYAETTSRETTGRVLAAAARRVRSL
ncbi:MAG TPA: phosphoglucomutase/phosphomannomutase family protein [Candidatus Acidoferrales bacterium]|nr:phosphoglucomutase/phosphomannomutase family protein [Candidatus Acidoferrales bacterium]